MKLKKKPEWGQKEGEKGKSRGKGSVGKKGKVDIPKIIVRIALE